MNVSQKEIQIYKYISINRQQSMSMSPFLYRAFIVVCSFVVHIIEVNLIGHLWQLSSYDVE